MPRPRKKIEDTMTSIPIKDVAKAKTAERLPAIVGETAMSLVDSDGERDWRNVVYEAEVDGQIRRYPTTTITPRRGKFFVMRTYEMNGNSRILVSPKDWNESFPFSMGQVLTKYGLINGQTCNISLKLIDVMVDVKKEEIIGVYLVVMTPSFVKIDVDARRLVKDVTDEDVHGIKEEVMVHEALNLKFQLEEALQRAETYRQALFNRDNNIVKLAEDFAAPNIEVTLAALDATKNMFEQYYKKKLPWYELYKWYILTGIAIIVMVAVAFVMRLGR